MPQGWDIVGSQPRNCVLGTGKVPKLGQPNLDNSGWDELLFQCWDIVMVPTDK